MQIKDMYKTKKPVLSLEVFPPKPDADFEELMGNLGRICRTGPDFVSVTCGAGGSGGTADRTRIVSSELKNKYNVEPLAHLTCIMSDREEIIASAKALKSEGISNVLALRGDVPAGVESAPGHYSYATQLIAELSELGGFCIGAACYPEGHINCETMEENVMRLREKQEAGASFFTSQLFFENRFFLEFIEKARKAGVTVPVSAGIMPVRTRAMLEKMIFTSAVSLPSAVIKFLRKYEDSPSDLRKAGLEYAIKQMEELKQNGVDGIHIYMMNRPNAAKTALARLR